MSVKDFMTKDLIVVSKETKIFDAVDLMKQKDIHRLPVISEGKLIGLVTEGTINEALPSKATSLSVHEMNYLLNKTVVSDIMIKQIETISPEEELEAAIYLMRRHKINVLPVVDGERLVGIITNNDIFDAFLKLTGYLKGGSQIQLEVQDRKGTLAEVTSLLAEKGLNILTILANPQTDHTILELQLESTNTQEIRSYLEDQGFKVIRAVTTEPK